MKIHKFNKVKDFLKEMGRMTNNCNIRCEDCDLSSERNSKKVNCVDLFCKYPEEAIKIVQDWSIKRPPEKAIVNDFFEKYPHAPKRANGLPIMCPHWIGYEKEAFCGLSKIYSIDQYTPKCIDCWTRPISQLNSIK